MNRGEFEGLKLRFGEDLSAWPAPFQSEAVLFLTAHRHGPLSEDETLDRLVLAAAMERTDERALARKVMARIAQPKRRTFDLIFAVGSWSMPATAASMALVLTVSTLGGYITAGRRAEISDNALMAFAVGVSPSEIVETTSVTRSNGGRP
ncbi:hypothetical protein [Ciceribacter azotifigens]|uniref:hypothetical protein n=1 Tax=Ciceribacter azotifigens TaxID=2069303 RepID=UPI003A8A9943